MSELILCSACTRHIRKDEARCPFCDAVVSEEQRAATTGAAPGPGASRARRYAARAAVIAGSAAFACSGTTETFRADAGPDAAAAGTAGSGGNAGAGGSIIVIGGSNNAGGSNTGGTAGIAGMGNTGNIPLPYGTVWPDDEEI
jgi:hypothetical protein